MILSDKDIKNKIDNGEIYIEPFDKKQIEPASIDLRLGSEFSKIEDGCPGTGEVKKITLDEEMPYRIYRNVESYTIEPHEFVLATTKETINVGRYTAFVEGRSSIGRLGLFIQNAGWVDPGFYGEITLELYNANSKPIKLIPGRRICQIVLAETNMIPSNPYDGKYQSQRGAVGSKIYQDRENKEE